MDINYELILKYLNTPKTNSFDFPTQKNIYKYSNTFPEKIQSLFTLKCYRLGITNYDCDNNNISFWSSIITLLDYDKNFNNPLNYDELEIIANFKIQLIDSYSKSLLSSFLKPFNKNDIREMINIEIDINILQYIVDILDINILIFDFSTFKINSIYHNDIMNPYKQIIYLAKYNNFWEPIISKNKILNNNIEYYDGIKINKIFNYFKNINDIIFYEKNKLKIINTDIGSGSDSEYKNFNKTKLLKMKNNELEIIIKKLEIISNGKLTKAIMVDKILEKIITI